MVKLGGSGVLAVVGVGVAAFVAWRIYQGAGSAAATVANVIKTDLNPTSSENIVNRGFNAVQQPVTGEASLSDWLLKKLNPSAYDALNSPQFTPYPVRSGPDTGDETARLLARYPAPPNGREPSSVFSGVGSFSEGADLGSLGFGGLWSPGHFTGYPQ